MSLKKTVLKNVLARQYLGSLSINSPLNKFSWNRVRFCLKEPSKSNIFYIGDALIIEFIMHKHCIGLYMDGRGILWNQYSKNHKPMYKLVMPKDVQNTIIELYELYKKPIPYSANKGLN